ncbi:common plant regulatory factor 1-like [Cornus florida]|uniref:common plant regulatory factor 1-like n=1 Tax=Cornus florida TaxID=4283 RepID=UPI00289FF654|nr:common plant regulatory factor 1-like [Cornus florida]XP_059651299.1 common plant regulatory factor 1-like [Cornus florida]
MGNSEEGKPCKREKPSSPPPDQPNVQMYPDWAAMQAYYGPRIAIPPYFNSANASGHAPHPYMWGPPQAMMPPYGAPYAAFYAHGGVYAHAGVPLAANPSSIETSAKTSENTDRGLMKKLKGFDGLSMSIGNGNADIAEDGADHGVSQSEETEGSSDGSSGNTAGVGQNGRKRNHEGTQTAGGDGKTETQNSPTRAGKVNGTSGKVMGVAVAPPSVAGKVMGTVLSPSMATAPDLRNATCANAKTSPTTVPQPSPMTPNEAWLPDERELKREKRKQSNRESARRSRLRKQAETEELAVRVESLTAENITLKSEVNRLTENSGKLKLENAKLLEKLKIARLGQTEEVILNKVNDKSDTPVKTENLLSRVNNSGSTNRTGEGSEIKEKNSGLKLHQLLEKSARADAVAAG